MREAFLIIKANLFNSYTIRRGSGAGGKRVAVVAVMAAAFLYLTVLLVIGNWFLGSQLEKTGTAWLLIAIAAMGIAVFVFIMALFRASSFLFAFQDYDMLMSLPAPSFAVLLAKITQFYISNLLITAFIYTPSAAVYMIVSHAGAARLLIIIFGFFIVPLIPMSAGTALAFPIAYIAGRVKWKNAFMVAGSLALILVLIIAPQIITRSVINSDVSQIVGASGALVMYYPPARWLAMSVGDVDLIKLAMFVLVSAAVFGAFLLAFGNLFKKINGVMTEKKSGAAYKAKPLKVSSPVMALFTTELRRWLGSYQYIMNTAIGAVMFTALACALLFVNTETLFSAILEIPELAGGYESIVFPVTLGIGAFFTSISVTTSASISLEGSRIWILKASPVCFKNIADSKILLNIAVNVPLIIVDAAIICVKFDLGIAKWALMCVSLALVSLFAAVVGFIMNLHFPKMDWKNQVQAIKQSMSVVATLFINMIAVGALGVGCGFLVYALGDIGYLITIAFVAAIIAGLYAYALKGGEKLFARL